LLIEFVPKGDPQVQVLLASRKDIFPEYSTEGFEAAFKHHFAIQRQAAVGNSGRSLYWMEARG
jgi:hypothetical protein